MQYATPLQRITAYPGAYGCQRAGQSRDQVESDDADATYDGGGGPVGP